MTRHGVAGAQGIQGPHNNHNQAYPPPRKVIVGFCADLGARPTQRRMFEDNRVVWILPPLHLHINGQKGVGALVGDGDNTEQHFLARAYGYSPMHAQLLEHAPKDAHKKEDFDRTLILAMLCHMFSEVLQTEEIDLFGVDAASTLLDHVRNSGTSGGETFRSFQSLCFDHLIVLYQTKKCGQAGPTSFNQSLACLKLCLDMFYSSNAHEYAPAVLEFLLMYLVLYDKNPVMQTYIRELYTTRTAEQTSRNGPFHGLDDQLEMRNKIFQSFNRSNEPKGMDEANFISSGPAQCMTEAVYRLMKKTPTASKQRVKVDDTAEILAFCRVFAEGRPGQILAPSDSKYNQLWDYRGTQQHNVSCGAHRILAFGQQQKEIHVHHATTLQPSLPVKKNPIYAMAAAARAKEKQEKADAEWKAAVAAENSQRLRLRLPLPPPP